MNDHDLNPDARRLVDLAREARTPGEEDKLRLAKRLAVPLAASAAVGTAVGGAKAASTTVLGSLGAKIAVVVAMGAAGTALVVGQLEPQEKIAVAPASHTAKVQEPPKPSETAPVVSPEDLALEQPQPKPSDPIAHQRAKPSDDLAQEAALLHQAQAAWRAGQSAQALQLANQHAARFPRSQLANERDVLRVLSLCKLGQVSAAKQVGARLLRTAKGSPWYQSVAGSCAAE
jgi:hypothetical protein